MNLEEATKYVHLQKNNAKNKKCDEHKGKYIPQRKAIIYKLIFNPKFIAYVDASRKGYYDFCDLLEDFIDDFGVTKSTFKDYDHYTSDNLSEACSYTDEFPEYRKINLN